jgi:hypothetical protein
MILPESLFCTVYACLIITIIIVYLEGQEFESPMDRFSYETAGEPIMYGICLQKQYLDPSHYPKMLEVRNGFRPFLYSLIGSWGPLMLPLPWVAFREW